MIRSLTPEELPHEGLMDAGATFFSEAKLPGLFIPSVFTTTWKTLLQTGAGVIFVSDDETTFHGAMGLVVHPDINDGLLVAQEVFWFMMPKQRRGMSSVRLYVAAESWARIRGAKRLAMASILGPYAESLRRFYEGQGMRPVEVNFYKDL